MKNILSIAMYAITLLSMISCSSSKEIYTIDPEGRLELEFKEYESYEAQISNKSNKDLEVKVINKANDEQVSGFGLGQRKKAKVMVGSNSKLVLVNGADEGAKVSIGTSEAMIKDLKQDPTYISFTLRNNSSKSIPLIIPTVMNPNLSPFSNSGVDLKVGQEILFRAKGKKYVLLTVSNEIKDGEILEVSKLLKQKKKELGI